MKKVFLLQHKKPDLAEIVSVLLKVPEGNSNGNLPNLIMRERLHTPEARCFQKPSKF